MYHITTVTAGREKVFSDLRLGRLVVRALMRLERSGRATTMAYVVMPDHLHWLFQLSNGANLSATVGSLKSQSSKAVNSGLGKSTPVWRRGFHDRGLRREEDIAQIARYIIANPLRAGLVSKVGDYPLWDATWV